MAQSGNGKDAPQIDTAQQRVAQLEQQLREMTESNVRCCNQWSFAEQEARDLAEQRDALHSLYVTLLELVQAYQQAVRDTQSVPATRGAYNRREESLALAKAQEALYCYPSTPPPDADRAG